MSTTIIALVLVASLASIVGALIYIHRQYTKKEKDRMLHQFSILCYTYNLSFSGQRKGRNHRCRILPSNSFLKMTRSL